MRSLAVRVLSDFGVDGIEPQALGSRKARLPLQLLAMAEGQAVPADVLIDALWGTAPPARPEDQVAVLMSRLRSVLGRDRIEHRDRGYLLHCDWLIPAEAAPDPPGLETRTRGGRGPGRAFADPRRGPAAGSRRVGTAQARRASATGQPGPAGRRRGAARGG